MLGYTLPGTTWINWMNFVMNQMKWLVFQAMILRLFGYTLPGTTWANDVMNHAPGAASTIRPVDQQSGALPLYYGCPPCCASCSVWHIWSISQCYFYLFIILLVYSNYQPYMTLFSHLSTRNILWIQNMGVSEVSFRLLFHIPWLGKKYF